MRVIPTDHYLIHTDLEDRLANDMASRMEAMYQQYQQRLADFSPRDTKRFEVYLFAKRKDYLNLTNNVYPNTGGIFMPRRSILAAFLEEQGRDGLRRTLQHEAFHQFAFTAISPKLPIWLNEGIAQVYEEGLWTGREFILGQVSPRRIRQLQQDMKDRRLVTFKEFLSTTDEAWGKDMADPATGAARYCQAWAMTHFLVFAKDESGNLRYRSRLIAMLKLIHDGTKAADAFTQAFSDNYEGFQDRFLEFTRSLEPTKESTLIEAQSTLADMLVILSKQDKRFETIEQFRQAMSDSGYRLRYTKGNVQWSTLADPDVYFKDADGRLMSAQQFYFSTRAGAPLPDMVCQPMPNLTFRTVFHYGTDRIDHETLIEGR